MRATGTTGTPASNASHAAPVRKSPTQPSGVRLPSGNKTRLHPSEMSWRAMRADRSPPLRATGKALNAMVVAMERYQVSKK